MRQQGGGAGCEGWTVVALVAWAGGMSQPCAGGEGWAVVVLVE